MSGRTWLLLCAVVAAGAFYFHKQQVTARDRRLQAAALETVAFQDAPLQFATNRAPFPFKDFQITPLAGFLVRARVLSTKRYALDTESRLAPLDLALGWKRMADPAVYGRLHVSQYGRWYRYRWDNQPPIPLEEIVASSGNMHMIPADEAVRNVLTSVEAGDYVRIKGMLVQVNRADGWRWRSSLSRTDGGSGSCEVVYVESAAVE